MNPKHIYILIAIAAFCYAAPKAARATLVFLALLSIELIKVTVAVLEGVQTVLETYVA